MPSPSHAEPAGHPTQAERSEFDTPPSVYEPASQVLQLDAPLSLNLLGAPHSSHALAPAPENLPGKQAKQDNKPATEEYLPAAHVSQLAQAGSWQLASYVGAEVGDEVQPCP